MIGDGWTVIVVLDQHPFQQPERTIMRVLHALQERGHPCAERVRRLGGDSHAEVNGQGVCRVAVRGGGRRTTAR
jgi:hypothetical protein